MSVPYLIPFVFTPVNDTDASSFKTSLRGDFLSGTNYEEYKGHIERRFKNLFLPHSHIVQYNIYYYNPFMPYISVKYKDEWFQWKFDDWYFDSEDFKQFYTNVVSYYGDMERDAAVALGGISTPLNSIDGNSRVEFKYKRKFVPRPSPIKEYNYDGTECETQCDDPPESDTDDHFSEVSDDSDDTHVD